MKLTGYTLFLDESTSDDDIYVGIGGFAIKNDDISLLKEKMNEVRKIIWDDVYIEQNNPTLHATELNIIYKNRYNKFLNNYIKRDEYNIFIGKNSEEIQTIYKSIYRELCIIFKNIDITIFSCVIDKNNYSYLYDKKHTDSFYHICLENIVENYIHFLDDKNAVGSIVYETRNSPHRNDAYSLDARMYNTFCAMKVANKGMISLTQKSTLFRLENFNFQRKSGDSLCLAFADFIIYNISKMQHIDEYNNRNEFMHKLYNYAYNGNYNIEEKDLRDYFGIKLFPYDIRMIQNLKIDNKRMKKTLKNKKNEIRKLERKNAKLIKEKEILEKQLNKLNDC